MASPDLSERISSLSPEKLALLKQRLSAKVPSAAQAPAIQRRTGSELRVLSFAQQGLWFLNQLRPATATYNIPFYCRIRGSLNVAALKRATSAVIARHEVLRTVYASFKGRPVPVLLKNWQEDFTEVDLRDLPTADREAEARRRLRAEAARPFQLSRDLMLRFLLLRLADDDFLFLHTSHHIAWDMRSKELLYQELAHHYDAEKSGRSASLSELPVQYADYAAWQRNWLQGEVLDRFVAYWRGHLASAPPSLELPADHPRPPVQSLRGSKIPAHLPHDLIEAVKALTRRSAVTPFMALLAGFKVLLYCYTAQEDICVGSPTAGRDAPELDGVIGFFINTVVLRTRLSPVMTYREVMGRVRDATLGAVANQALPFSKLAEVLQPPRALSRMPLFQVNFRAQGGLPVPLRLSGLDIGPAVFVDSGTSKFDLGLELPTTPGAVGFWEYSTDLFDEATIVRMAADLEELLRGLIAQPDVPLRTVPAVRAIFRRVRGVELN
jgi:hypothetical protein